MPSATSVKKGFTLFELMLVVLLIGIIYGVFVHKLSQKERHSGKDEVTLETLKEFLLQFSPKRTVVLKCITPCDTCYIFRDGKKAQDLEISLFEEAPNVYSSDPYGQLQRMTFTPIQGKHGEALDVCFEFTLFGNKSSSSYIIEYDKKVYLFDPYLKPVSVFDTLGAAKEVFDKSRLLPTQEQNYNN
jgi:prepilin-type N-terminal cleavage/methylation domain-containing protein